MSPDLEASFGAHLRRLRQTAGLTQEELAMRAGLSPDAVSALERGLRRRPYPHTVRALAEALELREEWAILVASYPNAPLPARRSPPPLPCPCHRRRWSDASGTYERWSRYCSGPRCGC
jgi:transcriptional regulator with XRE-family HTH domain